MLRIKLFEGIRLIRLTFSRAHALSAGGQKSRVAFADLALSNPDVIILVCVVKFRASAANC